MATTTVLQSPVRMCALAPRSSSESLFRPMQSAVLTASKMAAACTPKDTRGTGNSISHIANDDVLLVSLLSGIPQKPLDPSLERFQIYETAVQVYKAASGNGNLHQAIKKQLDFNRQLKQQVYQLVFETLHHREVIAELLAESGFFSRNIDLHSHEDLVFMIAYEFQREKFSLRLPREGADTLSSKVVRVVEALWSHKVKLGATLARMRVEHNASTVSQLIQNPQTKLRFHSAEHFYCSARVNSARVKSIQHEIIPGLLSEGVTLVQTYSELYGSTVYQPRQDLLVFSANCRPILYPSSLFKEGYLILQDLTSYFCVDQSVRTFVEKDEGDILFTDCFSGTEVIHAASILAKKGTVRVFNVSPHMVDIVNSKLIQLHLQNVQLICAPFLSSCPSDDTLSNIRLVVCLPSSPLHCPCSTHPVDYVLQEGDERLSILSPRTGMSTPHTDIHTIKEALSHALKFDQAKRIVFVSSDDTINVGSIVEGSKKFSLAHRPTAVGEGQEHLFKSSYSISVINKISAPPPKTVLARAIASGLLDTDCLDEVAIAPRKQISKKRKTRQARINALHRGIPLSSASSSETNSKKKLDKDVITKTHI